MNFSNRSLLKKSLGLPLLAWLIFFVVIPLGYVVVVSFLKRGTYGGLTSQVSFDNFIRAVDPLYLKVFWNSFKMASLTAAFCLVLSYPVAYVIARSSPKMKWSLVFLLAVPFLTNAVVRIFSLRSMFGDNGVVNAFLLSIGIIDEPILFAGRQWMLWIGMVTTYLPFQVLPLFVALDKFNFALLDAAADLGASSKQIFFKVLWPLTIPAALAGMILVFTPAMGEFLIPDLLTGAQTMLVGNLITEQFLKVRDWPFGAAISLVLIGCLIVSLYLLKRWEKKIA